MQRLHRWRTHIGLSILAALSSGLIGAVWGRHYALADTLERNRKNFASLARYASDQRWAAMLGWGGLWLLYAAACWWMARRRHGSSTARKEAALVSIILIGWLAMALPWLWTYPGSSLDLFDYNGRGHMLAHMGLSPLSTTPAQAFNDAFYPYLAWRSVVDSYGPAWELISAGTHALAGDQPSLRATLTTALTLYRVQALLLSGGVAALLWLWLRRERPQLATSALLLWLWNPLVLYETANGGHNDGWMLILVLLAAGAVLRGRGVLALLALALAAHFKITALLVLPPLGIVYWRRWGWRRTGQALLIALPLAAAGSWLLFQPLGGWQVWRVWLDDRSRFAHGSLGYWWAYAQASDGKVTADLARQSGIVASSIFAALLLGLLLWGWRRRTDLATLAWGTVAGYLLIGAFWFQPWYGLWLLPWAVLSRSRRIMGLTLGYLALVSTQMFIETWWAPPLRAALGAHAPDLLIGVPQLLGILGGLLSLGWFWWSDRRSIRYTHEDLLMSSTGTRTLVIVAKEPTPGRVKTRLGATLGHDRAAALYRAFSADTFRLIDQLPATSLAIAHWPPEAGVHFQRELGARGLIFAQEGADFGARLHHAFATAAAHGAERIVLIGTDSPSLPISIIEQAFARLDDQHIDGVIGPCSDGGWYLLGLRQPHAALFHDIAWSTEVVYQQTLERAAAAGLRLESLPTWYDIDTEADLARLHSDLAARPDASASHTLPLLTPLLKRAEALQ